MIEIRNSIAVITLRTPPLNFLDVALRKQIADDLDRAQADPDVRGIVLVGSPDAFSAGADVNEFGTLLQSAEPTLATVIGRLDACQKPVVAAMSGVVLGGGLELALACHGRVALETARLGLPEINLGLIPGAGGTQRLPRLVGLQTALELMQSGTPQTAKQLEASGLLDKVVEQDLIEAAIEQAAQFAGMTAALPRARDRVLNAAQVQAFVQAWRDKLTARQRLQPACIAVLDALQAVALDWQEGLRLERELYVQLQTGPASRALQHQFAAERDAAQLPADLQTAPRVVSVMAVVGAGTMGVGIAICALDAGLRVVLLEQDESALARGRRRVGEHYQGRVAAGKMSASVAQGAEDRLTVSLDWTLLAQADLIIEAVFEDLAVKQDVFRRIDAHARTGAVLATNTSYLDVDAIAQATSRPQDVLGLHFFSPANVMKLLEVVRGKDTAPEVLATGMALGQTLKKLPVLTGNAFGFIGNRIYNAYRKQCEFMLEDGAWPEDVDNALQDLGFAMGPFAVADLSGLDIAWRMRQAQAPTRHPDERYVAILDHLCEKGRLGRKAGAGYYTYTDGKQCKTTDGVVRGLIDQASFQRGIARHTLSAAEIQRRALLAMVNEAALLLQEGVASRASDIDVVLVQGYGFPRWEGGPVFWARQQQRQALDRDMQSLAREAGHGFVVADLSVLVD